QELVDGGMDHPELYASLLEVCLCKGYDEETLIKWFQKGLAKAPFYEHCYWQIANYYRKVWYGKPGHYQPIIDAAVEATRTRIGNAAGYYVFYQILLTDTDVFKASKNVSWSQVKGGYTDFIKVFPENAHHLNHVCRMACAFHERDDARMYFERIGERHAGEVWRKEMFDLWKNWACAGGGLPVSQPIHKAAQAGDVQGVRLELNHGVASNLLDEQGRTPMVLAIEQEAWPVVRLLLAHGADPNTRVDGRSLSGLVVSSGQLELLQDLLARGIDPNTVDEDGWTLLHTAASEDYAEVLRLLLSQPGIKVDSLTEQQLTPLSLAVRGKQVNAAKLLVERGASLKITGKNSNPPLVAAAGVGATDIAKFLLEKGADPNLFLPTSWTALTAAIDGGNSELVDALLAHGADVNRADGDGWTAMHMAAMNGNLPLLERLLNSPGANISVATNEGRTLLHQAVKSDQLDVLKFLLERGMKPEVTNREGETALDFARELGRKEIEAYLVSIGASANK
ncbi:MAG: ankyrin repeat domain-containing protein, partial [Candidatus Hydrogenedentes bacterium]|nr:ankyrin repeat domain-containing protein [Candidatus Hydrogenedentota bacterium]